MKLEEAIKSSPDGKVCTHFIREPGGPLVHAHVIPLGDERYFTMAKTANSEASTTCVTLPGVEMFMTLFKAYNPENWQVLEVKFICEKCEEPYDALRKCNSCGRNICVNCSDVIPSPDGNIQADLIQCWDCRYPESEE